MSSLAKAAKRLNPGAYSDVAGKMRMAGINSFAKLLTRALVFKETLAPNKQAFIALGAPANVDEELDDLITALQTAGDRKRAGLDTQIGGTLSIDAIAREGIQHVQQLDAIFTQLYRKDPVMLAQWNVAKRATPYAKGTASQTPDPGLALTVEALSRWSAKVEAVSPPLGKSDAISTGAKSRALNAANDFALATQLIVSPPGRHSTG